MANYNLAGQKIKDTYQQVAQVSGSTLVDGSGVATPIATSSIVSFNTEVSRSAAAAGFGAGTVDTSSLTPLSTFYAYTGSNDSVVDALVAATSSYLTSLPSGVVSSSAQVDLSLATGTAANATSASYAGNASTADSATSATSASYATSALSASYAPSAETASYALSALSASYAPSADTSSYALSALSSSYAVTASYVAGLAAPGLVAGSGTDSMRSSATLTTT